MPTIELRKSLSDGVYTIAETDDPDVLIFYRNDEEPLLDVNDGLILGFYQNFQAIKFFEEGSKGSDSCFISYNLTLEKSVDEKMIRITNKPFSQASSETKKKKGFFAKLKEFFK